MHLYESRSDNGLLMFGLGVSVGIAAAAIFSPRMGAARRAKLSDRAHALGRQLSDEAQRRAMRAKWRAKGALHEARARLQEEEVPDHILEERVRAQLGRPVSHPGSIEVKAESGCVTLSGPVLAHEVQGLLTRVRHVRGVRELRSALDVHESAEHVPGLQGSGTRQSH